MLTHVEVAKAWTKNQTMKLHSLRVLDKQSTEAIFVSYASELSKTYATLAITRMIEHLKIHGVAPNLVEVRTDLGSEFDGNTVHYCPEAFHGAIAAMDTYTASIHPRAPTATPTPKVSTQPSKTNSLIWKTFRAARTSWQRRAPISASTTSPGKTARAPTRPRLSCSVEKHPICTLTSSCYTLVSRPG
jgi:hypothetical protein